MSYLLLAGGLLLAALALRLAGGAAARRRGHRIRVLPTVLATLVLVVLTLAFDNLMIAAGLFAYADAHLAGVRVGLVPVEDLSYPIALAIALPGVRELMPQRRHDVRT